MPNRKILANPSFQYIQDIAAIAKGYFKDIGFNFFGHATVHKDGNFCFLSTDYHWPEAIFAEKELPPIGFTIFDQLTNKIFFPSMDKGDILGWSDEVTRESKERFGITNPMIITQKFDAHYEIFIFDMHGKNTYETYVNHFDIFENFIHYHKDEAKEMLNKINRDPLKINAEYLSALHNTIPLLSEPVSSLSFPHPKRYYLSHQNQTVIISAQEYQCLSLLARGKTLKSIANTLSISARTVETYLERMKKKLNVIHREELIDIYWKNKLLSGQIHDFS